MRKRETKALCLLLAALMLSLTVLPAAAVSSATASSIRLAKATGTVTVTNSTGRTLTMRNDMTLYNGYRVQTAARSYAWISLDSTKLTKLDASSRVEIRKSGSKLELLLSSGHIYFNVTSPLTSGETLNIRTSTMMMGIRGTSGWVNVVDRWTTEIYVLEGAVRCNATDPVTGQIKTATIESGEKAIAVAYPQDYEGDKCDIIQEKIKVSDLEGFVLTELAQDPELCEEIHERSGLDIQEAVEAAQERLEQDQQEMQNALDRIDEDWVIQDSSVSIDVVWDQEGDGSEHDNTPDNSAPSSSMPGSGNSGMGGSAGDGDDGGGSAGDGDNSSGSVGDGGDGDSAGDGDDSGGSAGDGDDSGGSAGDGGDSGGSTGDGDDSGGSAGDGDDSGGAQSVAKLTMPKSAQEVQDALNQTGVQQVVLLADDDLTQTTLYVDIAMTVPEGKTLTITDGITVEIRDTASLTVNGTMTGSTL